eukprot:5427744-Prymnesium_polylepis.1
MGALSSSAELQKLWDRDGDGRISKAEFRERVAGILHAKLTPTDKKDLDGVFDSMDDDGGGVLEIAE